MRELHGVIYGFSVTELLLKRQLLMFDSLYVIDEHFGENRIRFAESVQNDLTFLRANGVVHSFKPKSLHLNIAVDDLPPGADLASETYDSITRDAAGSLRSENVNAVAICELPLPKSLAAVPNRITALQTALRVGMGSLPVPGENCALEDLLEFRREAHDKLWGFRRFLNTLSTAKQTEREIRDDFEWTMNEYRKAMELHRLKSSDAFVDIFVVSPLEVVENLVKLNWSKIARGALSVRKRQVELFEAEMKAPGRECAYVFDAHDRFGT